VSKRWFLSLMLVLGLVGAISLVGCKAKVEEPAVAPAEQPAAEQPAAEAPAAAAPGDVAELKIKDIVVGKGAAAKNGDSLSMHYTGWLLDGTKFDSSLDSGQPFPFVLGQGGVIEGWDKGVLGMKVGGKRELTIPSAMGYGPQGSPPVIPPNAGLRFEVELLAIK